MLTLFTRYVTPDKNYALKLFPEWRYINDKVKDNIRGAVYYLRSINNRVETTNNPLYRLLYTHCPDITLTDIEFYKEAIYRKEQADSFYRFISINNNGKNYKDIIYKGCQEIFVNNEDDLGFEYIDDEDSWRMIQPLRIIYTDNVDLDYCLFSNKKQLSGIVVYEINILKLLFQYKKWANYRMMNFASIDPAIYLQQYVYTNAILDLVNLTIFNRLLYFLEKGSFPIKNNSKYYPFFMVDVTDKIDIVIERYCKEFNNRRTDIETLINSFPTIHFEEDYGMLHYLRVNVSEINKNCNWVPYITRFKMLGLIYKLLGETGSKYNRNYLTTFQEEIRKLSTGMVSFPQYLDPFTVSNTMDYINILKDMFLKNLNIKIR